LRDEPVSSLPHPAAQDERVATRSSAVSIPDATTRARQELSRGLEGEIAQLRQQRPLRRLTEILFFASLWILGIVIGLEGLGTGGAAGWLLMLCGVAASAAALNAFYLLSHEGHHGLLFRRTPLNHAVNVLLCVPLLHSPTAYRVLHELHHRYLGGPGDPDEYSNYTGNPRVIWALQWVRLTMGTLVYMPLIPVVAWRRAGRRDRLRIALEYAGMTPIWVAVFALVPMRDLLQAWLVPGVVVGYVSAVRALAQHALTHASDPLLSSRSVRSNRLVSFLLLNENFHLEHHLFPEVPSYRLPQLRALVRGRLPYCIEAPTYTRFLMNFVRRWLTGDDSTLGLCRAPDASRIES
jgi:fatty acid desaturase